MTLFLMHRLPDNWQMNLCSYLFPLFILFS